MESQWAIDRFSVNGMLMFLIIFILSFENNLSALPPSRADVFHLLEQMSSTKMCDGPTT